MVCLASRPYGGYYRNLGRETFMVPFTWENGWPVVNAGIGLVEDTFIRPKLPIQPKIEIKEKEDFDSLESFPLHFLFQRNPIVENYSLTERPGYLRMKLSPDKASSLVNPSMTLIRQQHMSFIFETSIDFSPRNEKEQAGIILNQSESYNYQFLVSKQGEKSLFSLIKTYDGKEELELTKELDSYYQNLTLRVEAKGQELTFSYSHDGKTFEVFAENKGARFLSTDIAGGFVGNCLGLYCTSNGVKTETVCDFDYLFYKGL